MFVFFTLLYLCDTLSVNRRIKQIASQQAIR
jgi:hypothetical protein